MDVETWDPIPLKDWILENWLGNGRVEETTADDWQRQMFIARAKKAFDERGILTGRIRTWFNVMLPDDEEGYDVGYPHVHQNDAATTLVYYVDVGDKPPRLDILEDGVIVDSHVPQTNEVVFIPNGVWHGVHRNNGSVPRVAMICTAYPS